MYLYPIPSPAQLSQCISDGPQTYTVGSSSLVLSPAPAVPLQPPWMDPITLSHLSCKLDLLLAPSLFCPPGSETVGCWLARALPLLWSPLTSFCCRVTLLLLLPDIYQGISFRNNSFNTTFNPPWSRCPRVSEMINGNSYYLRHILLMTESGKVKHTHKSFNCYSPCPQISRVPQISELTFISPLLFLKLQSFKASAKLPMCLYFVKIVYIWAKLYDIYSPDWLKHSVQLSEYAR